MAMKKEKETVWTVECEGLCCWQKGVTRWPLVMVWLFGPAALEDQLQFNLDDNVGERVAPGKDEEEMKMPIQFQINGESYFYHDKGLSFYNAENECIKAGGHLASIHTEEINKYANGVVLHYNSNAYRTWLGGYKNDYSYVYRWTDGSSWDYSRWSSDENRRSYTHKTCVQMDQRKTGRWVEASCSEVRPYVCKL